MGTRIDVLIDRGVGNFREQPAVLALLQEKTPAALAVRDYWASVEPSHERLMASIWESDPVHGFQEYFRSYTGPGNLFLKVSAAASNIRTGGRWRGFLSIPPLRAAHLRAFHAIAITLGATRLAYYPDVDDVSECFWGGGTFDDCIAILRQTFGVSQESIDAIPAHIVEEAVHGVPAVWYIEEPPVL